MVKEGCIAMTLWGLVLAVHLMAMATWTGGLAYALLVLGPSLATLSPTERLALNGQALRRSFLIVWHAMPLVLLTGWAMVFGVYGGFANVDWTVNAMQTLALVMAAVFLTLFFGPWKRFRAAPSTMAAGSIRRLMTLNLVLGVAVIIVASMGHWRT